MIREDLFKEVARESNFTQAEVREIGNAIFDKIKKTVADGEKITLSGFGVFESKKYEPRKFYNMQTEQIELLDSKVVPKFTASKAFKEMC